MSNAPLPKNTLDNPSAMARGYNLHYWWRSITEKYGPELLKIETSNWSKSSVQSLPVGGRNLLWGLSIQGISTSYRPMARN